MKLKKWLFGTVLSFCLLMNTLAMPAASAGVLDEFAEKNFPTIVALQDEYKNKSALLEGVEYYERWREYVDQGVAKLQEWGDKLKEKGMTLALDHFSEKIDDYVNENAPLKIESGSATKIVPVVTIGSKGYIGAAQIAPGAGRWRQRKIGPGLSRVRDLWRRINHSVSLYKRERIRWQLTGCCKSGHERIGLYLGKGAG